MLRRLLKNDWFTRKMVICSLKSIQILAMQATKEIENLLMDFAPMLREIWSRDVVKSRMSSLDLVLNLWLKLFVR